MLRIINIRFVYGKPVPTYLFEKSGSEPMGSAELCRDGSESARPRTRRGLFAILAFMERAGEVARQRRALLQLGDSELKDFGASRSDAWNEASKPWWDLPQDR